MNNLQNHIFVKLNISPFEEFKIHDESLTYRLRDDLIVEFKHPINNEWCIDKENYLSKLIINEKLINNGKYNKREQLFLNILKEETSYKYIVRNDKNKLQLFENKPVKINNHWLDYNYFLEHPDHFNIDKQVKFSDVIKNIDFEFIKSTDKEPFYIY